MHIVANRSTSDHNKKVQVAIVAEIVGQSDSSVKEETARGMNVVALYTKNYPLFSHEQLQLNDVMKICDEYI